MNKYETNRFHNPEKAREELAGERFVDFQQVFPELAKEVLRKLGLDPYEKYEFYVRPAKPHETTPRPPHYHVHNGYVIEARKLPPKPYDY